MSNENLQTRVELTEQEVQNICRGQHLPSTEESRTPIPVLSGATPLSGSKGSFGRALGRYLQEKAGRGWQAPCAFCEPLQSQAQVASGPGALEITHLGPASG